MIQPIRLSTLLEPFGLSAPTDIELEHVYHFSADVTPSSVFVALPGQNTHGAKFAHQAILHGAVAIITDTSGSELINIDVPVIVVDQPRLELAKLAKLIYGPQIADLKLWGITGTNGKTTTSYLLRAILPQPAAAIGTTGVVYGESREPLSHTTPEIDDLYRLLIKLRKSGIKKIVMEVSSHALVMHRVTGIEFQAVAFTNLSQDHLDFHSSMDAYLQAKAKLFSPEFSKYAVISTDTPAGVAMADIAEANGLVVSTVSIDNSNATWFLSDEVTSLDTAEATIHPIGLRLKIGVGGRFNLANALLAVAMRDQLDEISAETLKPLTNLHIPGRMQTIAGNGVNAVVDYAHTPAAIAAVIAQLRMATTGKLTIVIGAGGNRDTSKRRYMGQALIGADRVIITDDNPRNEDPASIRDQIRSGITDPSIEVLEIADRRLAIRTAIQQVTSSNDLVAVLGKGHEIGQQIGDEIIEFDDVVQVKAAIAERGSR